MAQRPTRSPRWAFGDSAGLVEPVSTLAETGFTSGYRPPAQWVNYLLHFALAWVDHLRGPGWGSWTRSAHGGTIATLATVRGLAVDPDDARAAAQRYRYAIVGHTSAPAPKIGVSRNGLTWQDRSVPTGFTGTIRGIAYGAGLWVLWGTGTSQTWTTIADDGSANSAIGTDDATDWATLSAASGYRVGGAAWNGGTEIYLVDRLSAGNSDLVRTSDGGSSWSITTLSWPSSSYIGADIVYDDSRSRYVVSTGVGGIGTYTPTSATPSSGLIATLSGISTDADVRLRVGGPEDARTLLAWASYRHDGTTALSASLVWRSTNGGTSWSAITLPAAMSASGGAAIVTDLAHVDGVWIATTTAAPYLWRSDDDGQTWERVALPIGEEASWALHRAVYADGAVLCTGLTWTVTSSRASATSPGTWTSREPTYLADAGYLRGARIATTAPTSGQALAWNAATSRWEPTTIASYTSPLTTRGDLLVRGASSDTRLAVGASGRYLRSNGTDPSWAQIPSSDVTGLGALATLGAGSGLTTSGSNLVVDTSTIADRSYVDATVGGLLYKRACRAVATSNVASLSGTTTVDGVSLLAGDRVLLTAQSAAAQNGPWVVAAGSWTRPSPTELQASAAFPVAEGTTNADTIWYVTTNDPITQGVTSISIARATLTVTASGITDSTSAGRALLTAATASAQRTALGVQDSPRLIPLASYESTTSTADVAIGGARFDPADYSISGRTTTLTLEAIGQVVSGVTGTLTLRNLTDATDDATLSWTETSATRKTASITLPGSAKLYELRFRKSGGAVSDYAVVMGANVRITWS